ncbi:MAG TPA: transcriptional repressor [Dehalococcoidia bacterium]|nr:transcriptional repressor [Dehalococcoidia bacterium]
MRINHNNALSIKDRPVTAQRQLLLNILCEADQHLDAKELYRRAVERDRNISLATVYRNLRLFKELGLVGETRLDDVHCYYEIKRSKEHYHMVCTNCGRVIEFQSPLVNKLLDEVQRKCSFKADKVVLHLEGYCKRCSGGKKPVEYQGREDD